PLTVVSPDMVTSRVVLPPDVVSVPLRVVFPTRLRAYDCPRADAAPPDTFRLRANVIPPPITSPPPPAPAVALPVTSTPEGSAPRAPASVMTTYPPLIVVKPV